MGSNTVENTISVVSFLLLIWSFGVEAQLSPSNFYNATCPNALTTIRTVIRSAISSERRMAASLIRLHFHDCFVQGCDGSILLDQTSTIQSEKFSLANNNSIRGFNVIENAKSEVEKICPGIVSCADILAVAARDSSVANFYSSSCPNALSTIRSVVRSAISRERRMAGSLIRLHFHDCFVQGCDASIMLDETSTIESEKTSIANVNSARGFNVIEDAKRAVEKICPGVVSCADILAVAARDSSAAVGGPSYSVQLGRRDSTTASRTLANRDLPSPFADLQSLIDLFDRKGLNAREMVALSVCIEIEFIVLFFGNMIEFQMCQ
ncbi:OLC1v1033191C1 [Oldenlandia corymbosa var. corymbosa]|uniref:Peroxidase n=1 Tax=Oldenlandia corymbosa var. corymbosa TaxID=529605 RepID=A0AAV1CQZ5_OLDCO|nr:OLC1v1033191C1 [Oldenlandia corymbosa var. corymbosa]